MLEPAEIALRACSLLASGVLSGRRIVVTAGPTREAIDPVRYITNHSSGKMGYAVARAARELGANVTLVSGPTSLPEPAGVARITVQSAADMHATVMANVAGADIFIAAAAVADYAPATVADAKIKKNAEDIRLELQRNPDILADVARQDNAPFTVGFAAETNDVRDNALAKLKRKGLDMIAANQVGEGKGFDVDENMLTVYWNDGHRQLGPDDKLQVARDLMALVVERTAPA